MNTVEHKPLYVVILETLDISVFDSRRKTKGWLADNKNIVKREY